MQAPPDNNQQGGGAPVIDGGQSPQPQPLAAAPVALPSLQAAMGAAAAGGFPITIQPAAADAGAPGAVRPAAGAGTAAPQLTPMPVLTSPTGVPLLPMLNPAAFQGLQPGFAVRPGMQPVSAGAQHVPGPPFFFPAVPLQQPAVAAAAPAAAAQVAVVAPSPARRPSGSRRDRSAAASSAAKKHCNCKNSRCLKLYCECFASGRYCDGCNCVNCCNNHEHESTRQAAVEAILERNPNAFRPKIAAGSASARHNKGCNCKKSGCLKKYCECFQAGIFCSDNCKCLDCKNFEGSAARSALGPVAADASRQAAAEGASPGQRRGGITTRAAANASPSRQGTASAQAPLVQLPAPAAVTQQQKQAAAKEAMREVIKPEVIEKLCMLLMVVSQEEAERWKGGGGDVAGGGMDQAPQPAEQPLQQQQQQNAQQPSNGDLQTGDPMDVDSQQAQRQQQALTPEVAAAAAAPATEAAGLAPPAAPAEAAPGAPSAMAVDDGDEGSPGASQPAGGSTLSLEQQQQLEAAQEQLVLEEFRNALQMIGRVVGDKAVKKLQVTKAAASAQQQLLAMAAIQQQLAQQQQQQQPSARAASGISGGASGAASGATPPVAAGAPAAQPQLFLLPQQLVAQQLALGGGMGGMFLQQTPQGLVLRQVDPAAAQQQQQQPAASAQASVWSGATTGADGGAGPAATNTTSK